MAAFSGMSEIADSEGFVVCYPQGLPDFGNITHWNANLGISNVNDIQFLTELALYLQTSLDLSSDCTYSCGYSNGGYMSYSLACAMPEVFKAIGSVGGTMSGEAWETCEAQAVPVVHIHGTADGVVPYGSTLGSNDPWDGAPDVETVVAHWANANGCTEVTTTSLPDLDPSDGSTVDLIEHSDTRPKCIASMEVAMTGLVPGGIWISKVQPPCGHFGLHFVRIPCRLLSRFCRSNSSNRICVRRNPISSSHTKTFD